LFNIQQKKWIKNLVKNLENQRSNMSRTLKFIVLIIFSISLFNCQSKVDQKKEVNNLKETEEVITFFGNYVSESYSKRNEGYDWVAVSITQWNSDEAKIKIRSRADKKKPTCTLDAIAKKVTSTIYESTLDGKAVLFTLENNTLSIKTKNEKDNDFLSFYCSGGASISGRYLKINEPLDVTQIDKTNFNKTLMLQNIGFTVTSIKNEFNTEITIVPFGLEISNRILKHEIDGTITNAEIEDLNSDGFPELLIYTTSYGSGSYGNVIGYSVNNGKSVSQIYFPPISQNPELNKGYMGHDEFAIVETSLVQRFKTYNPEDSNSNPTGKIRQIQYKLVDGEASRRFEVKNITEFD